MYFQKKKKNNTLSPLEVFFKRADGSERQLRIVLVYFHKNYDNKLMRNIYFVDALFHCISCAMFTIAICMYVHIWMYVFGMWQYLGTKWLVNCTLTPMYVGSAIKATKQKHKFTGNPLTFHYLVAVVDYSCYYFYFWTLTGELWLLLDERYLDVAVYLLFLPLQPPLINVGLFYFLCCCWNSKLHNGSERRRKLSYAFTVNSSCICFCARGEQRK